jgi:hypothetical protein
MKKNASCIFVTLATLALMVASPLAQQPAPQATPTFKSSTKLVVQTVTVKDKDGKPIEGLTAKDFTVTEDGELQTISFVEYQRLDTARERSDFGPVVTADTTATPATPTLPSTTAVNNCSFCISISRPCRPPIRCAPTRRRSNTSTRRSGRWISCA